MLNWSWMGKCSISEALALQEYLVLNKQSHILFAEHYPVYVCPENKYSEDLWREPPTAKDLRMLTLIGSRGGSITYHGPGQIVCYMILDLEKLGIKSMTTVNVIIDTVVQRYLIELGIASYQRKNPMAAQGIWVGERKIASRGLRRTGNFLRFGFALNLATHISYFDKIYPCGIDIEITSVLRESHQLILPFQSVSTLAHHFSEALGVTMCSYPHVLLDKK